MKWVDVKLANPMSHDAAIVHTLNLRAGETTLYFLMITLRLHPIDVLDHALILS